MRTHDLQLALRYTVDIFMGAFLGDDLPWLLWLSMVLGGTSYLALISPSSPIVIVGFLLVCTGALRLVVDAGLSAWPYAIHLVLPIVTVYGKILQQKSSPKVSPCIFDV